MIDMEYHIARGSYLYNYYLKNGTGKMTFVNRLGTDEKVFKFSVFVLVTKMM